MRIFLKGLAHKQSLEENISYRERNESENTKGQVLISN